MTRVCRCWNCNNRIYDERHGRQVEVITCSRKGLLEVSVEGRVLMTLDHKCRHCRAFNVLVVRFRGGEAVPPRAADHVEVLEAAAQ